MGRKPSAPAAYIPPPEGAQEVKKRENDQARIKATYDLPPWLIDTVDEIAGKTYSRSGLAGVLLAYGLAAYRRGEIDLARLSRPSRSPRFEFLLDIPDPDRLASNAGN